VRNPSQAGELLLEGGVASNPIARGCVSRARPFEKRLSLSAMQNRNGRGGEDCAARK
jgi:hypothetical protein